MKRSSRYLIALLPIGALSGIIFPACTPPPRTNRAAPSKDIRYPLQDFTLTERGGAKVGKADLLGRVWIASFVFTRCMLECPQVTKTMSRLQQDFADEPGVRLVTFTVDPSRDNPAELGKYADLYHADKDRWWFLTGKEEEIHHLLQESFMIGVTRNPKAKDAGQEFDHSTRLVVVDRKGQVRGYYRGMADPESQGNDPALEADLVNLKAKVKELLQENE